MFPPDPETSANAFTYVLMFVLALWGGTVNYVTRIKSGAVLRFSFIEYIGELCISGFSGILVYLLAAHFETPPLLSAAMVGVAGHAGCRMIFIIERMFTQKLDGLTNKINRS